MEHRRCPAECAAPPVTTYTFLKVLKERERKKKGLQHAAPFCNWLFTVWKVYVALNVSCTLKLAVSPRRSFVYCLLLLSFVNSRRSLTYQRGSIVLHGLLAFH